MNKNIFSQGKNGVEFFVYITPGACKNSICGVVMSTEFYGKMALKVSITARPKDNEANKELVSFVAKIFGLPKGRVLITSGQKSRRKRILLDGVDIEGETPDEIKAAIGDGEVHHQRGLF